MIRTLFVAVLALALAALPAQGQVEPDARLELDVGAGYRAGQLVWSVGHPTSINVLSELTYRDIAVLEGRVGAVYRVAGGERRQWLLAAEVRRGRIVGGESRDSDYAAAGREDEHFRSLAAVTGRGVGSESLALGVRQVLPSAPLLEDVSVWAGLRRDRQTVRKQDGVIVIPDYMSDDLLAGLDSRYRARWIGPWIAVEPSASVGRGRLDGRVAIHFLTAYHGEGTWNLREDLAQPRSFVHEAMALGLRARLRYRQRLREGLGIHVEAGYARDVAGPGQDVVFYADGRTGGANLREVAWRSLGLEGGFSLKF